MLDSAVIQEQDGELREWLEAEFDYKSAQSYTPLD